MNKAKNVLFINFLLITFLVFTTASIIKNQENVIDKLQFRLKTEIEARIEVKKRSMEKEQKLMVKIIQMENEIENLKLVSEVAIVNANVTSYAPLCPDAIEGWDYSGDPSITASGEKVIPYQTAAGGQGYQIGDKVYIEGDGWWIINDRGGGLSYWQIDRAVNSKTEARKWGREERMIIIDRSDRN